MQTSITSCMIERMSNKFAKIILCENKLFLFLPIVFRKHKDLMNCRQKQLIISRERCRLVYIFKLNLNYKL